VANQVEERGRNNNSLPHHMNSGIASRSDSSGEQKRPRSKSRERVHGKAGCGVGEISITPSSSATSSSAPTLKNPIATFSPQPRRLPSHSKASTTSPSPMEDVGSTSGNSSAPKSGAQKPPLDTATGNKNISKNSPAVSSTRDYSVSQQQHSKRSSVGTNDGSLLTPTIDSLHEWSMSQRLTTLSASSSSGSVSASGESIVKVAVRVRPFSTTEMQTASRRIVSFKDDKLVIVNPNAFDADPDAIADAAAVYRLKEWAQVFRFNHCLWSYDPSDNEDEYISQEVAIYLQLMYT
jgi:hypothetical protein